MKVEKTELEETPVSLFPVFQVRYLTNVVRFFSIRDSSSQCIAISRSEPFGRANCKCPIPKPDLATGLRVCAQPASGSESN